MAKYSFRVEIEVTADTSPTDSTIGLASGKFIWIAGENYTYSSLLRGILSDDWVDSIKKSVNVSRFGDVANIDGLSLKIKNTSKFWTHFITAFGDNASLHGSKVSIYEMKPNGGSFDSTLVYVGYCDLPSFDKATYKIPVRGAGDVRSSYLTKPITSDFLTDSYGSYVDEDALGKTLPITLGEHSKAYFLKTGERDLISSVTDDIHGAKSVFPIVSAINGAYNISFKVAPVGATITDNNIEDFINIGSAFVKIINGDLSGQMFLVTSVFSFVNNVYSLDIDRPVLNPDGAIPSESSCQLVLKQDIYSGDFWDCEGFTRDYTKDVFSFEKGYKKLPPNTIDSNGNNSLIDNPRRVKNEQGLYGFDINQDTRVMRVFDPQVILPSGYVYFNALNCFVPSGSTNNGIYNISQDVSGDTRQKTIVESSGANWNVSVNLNPSDNKQFTKVYSIDMPSDIPDSFDSSHLCLQARVQPLDTASITLKIVTKKWWESTYTEIFTRTESVGFTNRYTLNNFPNDYQNNFSYSDFWTNDYDSYTETGYIRTDLGLNTKDEFSSVDKLFIIMEINLVDAEGYDADISCGIACASFVFTSNADTSKGIYTEFKGRTWKDNVYPTLGWNATELINSPIEALAHTKLLQNYSNDGVTAPSGGWGADYSGITITNALNLAQNTTGSFYHNDFTNFGWNDCEISKQVTDSKDSTTKSLTKDLCNRFFLVNWVNNYGNECVAQIAQKSSLSVTETITQAQMISWGDRVEQDSRNIFVEPSVSWGYNPVTKTFKGTMSITNVSSNLTLESDKADAVKGLDGFSDSYKASLWDLCRALYKYYGVINEPPKVLSEQTWIGKITDADWYLRKWIRFMGAGVVNGSAKVVPKTYFDFVVPYEVGRLWDIGTRINVQVPNITDNSPYEAFIYSISKNIAGKMPTISVKVILFDQDVIEEYDIQDSYDDTLDTWQDSVDSLQDNIQDEV